MSKSNRQIRKELGYEENAYNAASESKTAIPGRYFAYTAISVFIIGIIGMYNEIESSDINYLLLYFSMSFFAAPAILAFPVIRMFIGEEKTGLAAFLSALFGYYVQSSIKKRMK